MNSFPGTFWSDAFDGDWAARNKCNGHSARLEERHGGKLSYGGPFFVHTFAMLVPPAEYFKDHPEYFAQKPDGTRSAAQICPTHPEVAQIAIRHVRQVMQAKVSPRKGLRIIYGLRSTLAKYGAVLAGGTALALHLGHRISVDLDFFTNMNFNVESLI